MPLSESDLSNIAKEISSAKKQLDGAKDAIPNIQKQVTEKIEAVKRIKILYNNSALDKVEPYEEEHKWLDGSSYSKITDEVIENSAKRADGNVFFPTDWKLTAAKVIDLANGLPKSSISNNELEILSKNLTQNGLIELLKLLVDGQNSSVTDMVLSSNYVVGSGTMQVVSGSPTVGKLLYVSDGTNSGCFYISSKIGQQLTVQEIIAPLNDIQKINSTVKENIPGFSDSERAASTSSRHQNVLNSLIVKIKAAMSSWKTAIDGQNLNLNKNYDNIAQITNNKNKLSLLISQYDVWFSKADTGVDGKWTNLNLGPIRQSISSRLSEIPSRVSEIQVALGSISQDSKGKYSGTGHYLQRFKCLNFLINGANGALYERYNLESLKTTFDSKVSNELDKFSTFRNAVVYCSIIEDHKGSTTIKVDSPLGFSAGDKILACADDQPALSLTIVSIAGTSISLDKELSAAYTKSTGAGLIKAV